MTCNEFTAQISNFITGDIQYSELNEFINHLQNCKECYDDLEIYYMTNIGLERVDLDDSVSYNFRGELEEIIRKYELLIKRYTVFQRITKSITITANIILLVIAVIGFLIYFDVLN